MRLVDVGKVTFMHFPRVVACWGWTLSGLRGSPGAKTSRNRWNDVSMVESSARSCRSRASIQAQWSELHPPRGFGIPGAVERPCERDPPFRTDAPTIPWARWIRGVNSASVRQPRAARDSDRSTSTEVHAGTGLLAMRRSSKT